jgi:tetratricopeptide (TPR) repeat protein
LKIILYKLLKFYENLIDLQVRKQGVPMKKYTLSAVVVCSAAALLLAACQDQTPTTSPEKETKTSASRSLQEMMATHAKTDDDKEIAKGMQAIIEGDYTLASRTFNTLLIDDPLNSGLHTLNALTYQLMAKKNGETGKAELAEAGFQQALKIDPNNAFAALQLGRIKSEKQDYVAAQEQFARVLLEEPNNSKALYELAVASYHLGDAKTATTMIDRALTANPNSLQTIRAAALIYAAAGRTTQAKTYLTKYNALETSPRQKQYMTKRINDWAHFHKEGSLVVAQATPPTPDAAAQAAAAAAATPPAGAPGAAPTTPTDANAAALAAAAQAQVTPVPGATPTPPAITPTPAAGGGPQIEEDVDKMVVLDAVVMRVSDIGTTSKGNNIMDSLTMTLSPFNYLKARNAGGPIQAGVPFFPGNNLSDLVPTGQSGAQGAFGSIPLAPAGKVLNPNNGSTATLITQGLTFGTINYSLNIANIAKENVEIIGRPSLTSTVGKPATFFTGTEKHIAIAGNFGGSLTTTPVGFTLKVTVLKYEKGMVTLEIELEGSSIQNNLTPVATGTTTGAPQSVFDVDKSNMKTNVEVPVGCTIILGGHTERQTQTTKEGFPILQDIPIVQYFFSTETTKSARKSIMYLITPRSYNEAKQEAKQYFARGEEFGPRPELTALEKRHKDWYAPSNNNILTFARLAPLYHDYRTGDLKPIQWYHRNDDVEESVRAVAEFLWF